MHRRFLYRNIRARDNLELFLVAAITSLLLLRFFLYLAGYPQVGGGSLHIAHMLYGGLLMMAAIVLLVSFLGARIQRLAALIGGVGFGVFIDELGKFITKDNNYFFRPTIGIIYAIFIGLYLLFNFLSRKGRLTNQEYQLNALNQFQEAVLQDMDPTEKRRISEFLKRADASSPITQELQDLVRRLQPVAEQPSWISRQLDHLGDSYQGFWSRRGSRGVISLIFIAETVIFLVAVLISVFHDFHSLEDLFHGSISYGSELLVGQLATSLIAGVFVVFGILRLQKSRLEAFEQFRRATLITLFLTEFFIFSRIQFGAMPGFLVNLTLLLALRYSIYQEQHSRP